ncbi:MAG: hypothetical protein IJP04_12915 [Clostridia bacterium]|nr:hypothetical protein [Clostridia bacterium]
MEKKFCQGTEEKIIKLLIDKYEKSETNRVFLYRQECSDIQLSEQEAVRTLFLLKEDGLFDVVKKPTGNDFSTCWTLDLKPRCVHYFEEKSKERSKELREWLWWGIPTFLSLVALGVSIFFEVSGY